MNQKEFYKTVDGLDIKEASGLFYYLVGRYAGDKEFQEIVMKRIQKIEGKKITHAAT